MTSEERLDRIEHITAALAEERKKDREEYKALWRDTQRQIDANTRQIDANSRAIADLTRDISDLRITVRDIAEESRAADERLGARVEALVSAIGEYISRSK
jgi:hypothetical protein